MPLGAEACGCGSWSGDLVGRVRLVMGLVEVVLRVGS